MFRIACYGLGALAVALAASAEAQAWGLPPVHVKLTFRVDVRSADQPAPLYPWWMYFPYDPHLMAPASRPAYPNWPAPTPAPVRQTSIPHATPPAANFVWQPGRAAVQPASYQTGVVPGFSFDR